MESNQIKLTPILGELPGNTEWWTEKDWVDHAGYVEKLKKEGKYLTKGEEIIINFTPYEEFLDKGIADNISNFGIIIPN